MNLEESFLGNKMITHPIFDELFDGSFRICEFLFGKESKFISSLYSERDEWVLQKDSVAIVFGNAFSERIFIVRKCIQSW